MMVVPAFTQQAHMVNALEVLSSTVLQLVAMLKKLRSRLMDLLWSKLVRVGLQRQTHLRSLFVYQITRLQKQISALQHRITVKGTTTAGSRLKHKVTSPRKD